MSRRASWGSADGRRRVARTASGSLVTTFAVILVLLLPTGTSADSEDEPEQRRKQASSETTTVVDHSPPDRGEKAGTTSHVDGTGDVGCAGDGAWTIRVYHAIPAGHAGRPPAEARSAIVDALAVSVASFREQSAGLNSPRYSTRQDCEPLIRSLTPADASFAETVVALAPHRGAGRRRHAVFMDAPDPHGACGWGHFVSSDPAGFDDLVAVAFSDCWTARTIGHEILHTLGAVHLKAPNSDGDGHCVNGRDIMCAFNDHGGCHSPLTLDCQGDSYFNPHPIPGGWLNANPEFNTAFSPWLQRFLDTLGHTHAEAIAALADLGVINGYHGGIFRPQREVTRGQLAAMLDRMLADEPAPDRDGPVFTDTSGHTHEEAIHRTAALGLVHGHPDGTFRPNLAITRGQTGAVLHRTQARKRPR